MDVNTALFIISLVVFAGYLAEWVFKKLNVPDILILILVGYLLGPSVLSIVDLKTIGSIAPVFTTFTLLFLIFDGSLNIDLRSLIRGIGPGLSIGLVNFLLSSVVIATLFYFMTDDLVFALLLGFSLGGVSSSFILPVINQLKVDKKLFTLLTFESAVTDVLSIVLALAMMQVKILNKVHIKGALAQIAAMFFVAGFLGMLAGFLWIFLESKILEGNRNYIMTIAYVVLLYFITDYLKGSGAIAAMAFGIVIANSRIFVEIGRRLFKFRKTAAEKGEENITGQPKNIVSGQERMFYREISFFVKTFFFVYIGILLNVKNLTAVLWGGLISLIIMLARNINFLLVPGYKRSDKMLVNALFARGVAPATIILIALEKKIITDPLMVDTVYFVITGTIILSSLRIFFYKMSLRREIAAGEENVSPK